MKHIISSILFLFSAHSFAGTISEATASELKVLATYIYDNFGAQSELSETLDDDTLKVSAFIYNNTEYKMLTVYSGDTAHGPVYVSETLEIVGELSDGDIKINGQYIDLDDVIELED